MRLGGFRQCKIKVGSHGQNDVQRLRRFRRILGRRMDLRIDANEAWTADAVVDRIRELEPFGVTAVEQPVPHADVHVLSHARRRIHTPIVLDESICSRADAERAIAEGSCDLFNIRLSKCGGLLPSLDLAALASAHGLGFQLGCQVGETGILSAAGRAFACSVKGIRYLEGSYDMWLVKERLTRENLTFGWGGVAPRLTGPGLGVTVDANRLLRITLREEPLYG
jgi:muconate cycloisomerase